MKTEDLLAEIPRRRDIKAFSEAISNCSSTVAALSAMVLALEEMEYTTAAELIKSIRPKMAELDIATM